MVVIIKEPLRPGYDANCDFQCAFQPFIKCHATPRTRCKPKKPKDYMRVFSTPLHVLFLDNGAEQI